jgi:hypothetical protein
MAPTLRRAPPTTLALVETVTRPAVQHRLTPAALAVGALAGCALLAAVDPNEPGRYPACPTRTLLGIDCPACGTLRGVHALLNGRLGTALSHNLLLAVAVPVGILVWIRLVMAAAGRPVPRLDPPRWAVAGLAVVAVTYAVLRNLPVGALEWLASGA